MFQAQVGKKYEIFAMANLSTKTTGISGAVIWVSAGEFEGKKSTHGARIKVVEGNSMSASGLVDAVVITLTEDPKVLHGKLKKKTLAQVIDFIKVNRTVLLGYWKGKLDTLEMAAKIKPIIK